MHRISRITTSLLVVSLLALMTVASHAQDASLAQLPLLAPNNLTYLGSFALPANDGTGSAQGDLTYGGQALSVTPAGTLLVGGHTWYPSLCEVSIPGIGGTAAVVQPCADVTEGRLAQVDQGSQVEYGGSLQYGGRLILSTYSYYDADTNQVASHFASGPTLSAAGDVVGPVQIGATPAGFVSGYMGLIPAEWQAAFGGPALTGNCCLSIISRTSAGPAISVFNPADVGAVTPAPATQLIGYPLSAPLVTNIVAQNPLYVRGDQMGGVAFPNGTRSVLFIGVHGMGPHCYGEGAECNDPTSAYKGDHAYPYVHQVWAYDANQLLAVKNGQAKPSDVQPYATWQLTEMNNTGAATITSAFYDQVTNRIYITEYYGSNPRVHVYEVTGGSGTVTAPAAPAAPTPAPAPAAPPATPPAEPPTAVTPPTTTPPPTTVTPTPTDPTTPPTEERPRRRRSRRG